MARSESSAPRQRIIVSIRDPQSETEAAALRRLIDRVFVAATVLLSLFCGMFPFDFTFTFATAIGEIHRRFDLTLNQLHTAGDGPENVIFFLPFGFSLGALMWTPAFRRRFSPIFARIVTAVLLSAALSTTIEVSQVYLASRDPSLSDVTCNTIGGTLGFLLFVGFGEYVMRLLTRTVLAVKRAATARVYGVAALAWSVVFLAVPLAARDVGSLGSWMPAYPLLVGNETNNERGWKGSVANLWLGARSLNDDETERVLAHADPQSILREQTMSAYHFTGNGPYADATGHGGPLAWTADHPTEPGDGPPDRSGGASVGREGMPITWAWWLRSADGAMAFASYRISQTNAFTLVADVATTDLYQNDRYPRIVSISLDTLHCNLQLIQDFDKLIVRVRSGATGAGGTDPEFAVPGVFEGTDMRRIVITYDDGRLSVACDHTGPHYTVHLTPESWLVWRIYPRAGWRFRMDSPGQSACGLIYRAMALFPLGLLLGATVSARQKQKRNRPTAGSIVFVGVLAATVILEATLYGISRAPIHALGPITSLLAGLIGAFIIARTAVLPGAEN